MVKISIYWKVSRPTHLTYSKIWERLSTFFLTRQALSPKTNLFLNESQFSVEILCKEFQHRIIKSLILKLYQVLLNFFNAYHFATSALADGTKMRAIYGTLDRVWTRYVCWTWLEMLNSLVILVIGQMSQFSWKIQRNQKVNFLSNLK